MAELARKPAKRAKLLSDSGSSSEDDSGDEAGQNLKVNQDFARRFEHNKKREELQRLEEKYPGANTKSRATRLERDGIADGDEEDESEEDSEDDESEDSDGELATERLDDEISATLRAIREKDPRVYDESVRFYSEFDETPGQQAEGEKKEKPMYLHDYHRRNLLAGHTDAEEEEEDVPMTYQQEQDAMKRQLVDSMHATANETNDLQNNNDNGASDDGDDFLIAKSKPKHEHQSVTEPKTKARPLRLTTTDIESADHDPETYLSNFLASRAWLPSSNDPSTLKPFESDDSDDEARADAFEEAYNLRFEDPAAANETLKSFSRDVGKYSVRREEEGGRKRKREREREKKEVEKREREEERARLKRLRREVLEEKVGRIRDAGGLENGDNLEAWEGFLENDWEDDKWEEEMGKRFGEGYYAQREEVESDGEAGRKRKKPKKPKWDEDIDIDDLVPGFAEEEAQATFTLSDEEDESNGIVEGREGQSTSETENNLGTQHPSSAKPKIKKAQSKHAKRLDRAHIDSLVEASLPLSTHPALPPVSKNQDHAQPAFRYRDTSPISFGLTAKDILFAEDAQLNAFAGLKKLAAWREEGKKRKDRRRLGKKGRVREWRKDVFGDEEGPVVNLNNDLGVNGTKEGGQRDGKRKRRKKGKGAKAEEVKT